MGERPNDFERARLCIAAMEPAIAKQGGHNRTFAAACAAAVGFGLSEAQVMELLHEYNLRCQPAWSNRELAHKARQAMREAESHPQKVGYLRDAKPKGWEDREFSSNRNQFRKGKNEFPQGKDGFSKSGKRFPEEQKPVSRGEKRVSDGQKTRSKTVPTEKKRRKKTQQTAFPPVLPRRGRVAGVDSQTGQTQYGPISLPIHARAPAHTRREEKASEVSGPAQAAPKPPPPPLPLGQPDPRPRRRQGGDCCQWSPPPYFRRVALMVWRGARRVEEVTYEPDPAGDHVKIEGRHYLSFQALEKRMMMAKRKETI